MHSHVFKCEILLEVCVCVFGVSVCVWYCVPYLLKMRNVRLPPVKLKLLVNVVLQALTHAALLVC